MSNLYRLCRVCERYAPENLVVFGKPLCKACETRLLRAQPEDPLIELYLKRMRPAAEKPGRVRPAVKREKSRRQPM